MKYQLLQEINSLKVLDRFNNDDRYSFKILSRTIPLLAFLVFLFSGCASTKGVESDTYNLNQGYGEVDAKKSTTAISQIEVKDKDAATSWIQLFQQSSGVTVSGHGNDLSIQIRAKKSMNSGFEPLFVVDDRIMGNGFRHVSFIDPFMVKRITVLKDAAAASAYGSRGADGVILITLKK